MRTGEIRLGNCLELMLGSAVYLEPSDKPPLHLLRLCDLGTEILRYSNALPLQRERNTTPLSRNLA